MAKEFSHVQIDKINLEDDRRIARQLRRDACLLRSARRNLRRWMKRDGKSAPRAFQEWDQILTVLSRSQIADFLTSDTPMARRLRQSSPFMGPIKDAKTRAVRKPK
jgi:transposase InsO family protein